MIMTDAEKAKAGKAKYMKEYRDKNKEKVAAYQKEYSKSWRENNPDKVKEYNDRYYAKIFNRSQDNQSSVEEGQ
jgi:hypothetical protein